MIMDKVIYVIMKWGIIKIIYLFKYKILLNLWIIWYFIGGIG